jgi:putative DNA primase/helicase
MLAKGLHLVPGKVRQLINFLQCKLPHDRFLAVYKSGWLDSKWVFIHNDWIAGNIVEKVKFIGDQATTCSTKLFQSGTLDEWKSNIAEPLIGNSFAIFAVIFAFIGPLLKILGVDGGGIHYFGSSSVGKTTALQLSSSVFGNGISPSVNADDSFIKQWNVTSNAIEAIAAMRTDLLTPLDEVGLYSGRDLGGDLYLLAGGRGKGTLDSQRRLRPVRTWRGNVFSTGEMTMAEAIERRGGHVNAGMLVRLIDIPVTNILPNPPEGVTPADFSNQLKLNCSMYYGTAGREFISYLVDNLRENPEPIIAALRQTLVEYTRALTPLNATPLQERALRRFAAIKLAGHAAVEAEILPYTIEEVDHCINDVVSAWMQSCNTTTDVQRAIIRLQDFLLVHGNSLPSFYDMQTRNPKGFRDASKGLFAFTDEQLKVATGATNIIEIAKAMRNMEFLFCNEHSRLKAKLRISCDAESRFYTINRKFLTADLQRNDESNTVHLGENNAGDIISHEF